VFTFIFFAYNCAAFSKGDKMGKLIHPKTNIHILYIF